MSVRRSPGCSRRPCWPRADTSPPPRRRRGRQRAAGRQGPLRAAPRHDEGRRPHGRARQRHRLHLGRGAPRPARGAPALLQRERAGVGHAHLADGRVRRGHGRLRRARQRGAGHAGARARAGWRRRSSTTTRAATSSGATCRSRWRRTAASPGGRASAPTRGSRTGRSPSEPPAGCPRTGIPSVMRRLLPLLASSPGSGSACAVARGDAEVRSGGEPAGRFAEGVIDVTGPLLVRCEGGAELRAQNGVVNRTPTRSSSRATSTSRTHSAASRPTRPPTSPRSGGSTPPATWSSRLERVGAARPGARVLPPDAEPAPGAGHRPSAATPHPPAEEAARRRPGRATPRRSRWTSTPTG